MGCGASANGKACPEHSDVAKTEDTATINSEPALAEKPSQGEPVTAAVQGAPPAVAVVDTEAKMTDTGKDAAATAVEQGEAPKASPPEKEVPVAETADTTGTKPSEE